jgi:hypothetical protein
MVGEDENVIKAIHIASRDRLVVASYYGFINGSIVCAMSIVAKIPLTSILLLLLLSSPLSQTLRHIWEKISQFWRIRIPFQSPFLV